MPTSLPCAANTAGHSPSKTMAEEAPKVSVSLITYNHQDYIGQAIEGVLKQQVDFAYEIIIGDDCSTDGTREVLQTYQQRYPDIIQLILHPRRYQGVPGRLNNITNLYACRGQYIAMLDGDDHWTSEHKLQQQVDFLDQHPNYSLAFHDALIVSADQSFDDFLCSRQRRVFQSDHTFTLEDVIAESSFAPTSSIVFRNGLIGEFPDWFWKIVSADAALQLLLAQRGKLKYFSQVNSVYLIRAHGFMSLHYFDTKTIRLKIRELELYRSVFLPWKLDRHVYQRIRLSYGINKRIAQFKFRLAVRLKKEKKYTRLLAYLIKSSLTNFSFVFYPTIVLKRIKGSSDSRSA